MSVASINRTSATHSSPSVSVETVGPEKAAAWLATSAGNRRVKQPHVQKLASQMTAGRWMTYGGSWVTFDRFGRLIDGHHRLTAIIVSGCTVEMAVVRGIEHEDPQRGQIYTSAWSTADFLERSGVKYSNSVAAAAAVVLTLRGVESGRWSKMHINARVIISDILEAFSDASALEWWVGECQPFSKNRLALSTSELAGFIYHAHTHPANPNPRAAEFIRLATFGENIGKGHPVFMLRDRLLDSGMRGAHRRHARFVVLVKAWNAFMESRTITLLRATSDESLAEIVKV